MADIIVTVIDPMQNKTDTVTLPGIPRQGDNFQWDTDGAATAIQSVTWNGDATSGGIIITVS